MANISAQHRSWTSAIRLTRCIVFLCAFADLYGSYLFWDLFSSCEQDTAKEDSRGEVLSWKTQAAFLFCLVHVVLMVSALLPKINPLESKTLSMFQRWEKFAVAYLIASFSLMLYNIIWALSFSNCTRYIPFLFTESASIMSYSIMMKANMDMVTQMLMYISIYFVKIMIVVCYMACRELMEKEEQKKTELVGLTIKGMELGMIKGNDITIATRKGEDMEMALTLFIVFTLTYSLLFFAARCLIN